VPGTQYSGQVQPCRTTLRPYRVWYPVTNTITTWVTLSGAAVCCAGQPSTGQWLG